MFNHLGSFLPPPAWPGRSQALREEEIGQCADTS